MKNLQPVSLSLYFIFVAAMLPMTAQATLAAKIDSAQPMASADAKALTVLENEFLHRTFEDDPLEKRMKRLELFVDGVGHFGPIAQRIKELKAAIASKNAGQKGVLPPTKRNTGQSITTLENFILKHNYPKMEFGERLNNLERKVFGTTFATIPVEQRVARLQKTLGVGGEDVAELPGSRMAPPGMMFSAPFMSPFATPNDLTTDPDINRHMSQMFDHLNRQLQQLHRMPNDIRSFPESIYGDGLPSMPPTNQGEPQSKPSLPPYMDPNSI